MVGKKAKGKRREKNICVSTRQENVLCQQELPAVEIWKKVSHLNKSRRAAEALWRGTNESWNLVLLLRRFRVAVDTWWVIKHWLFLSRKPYLCSVLYTFLSDDASADHERPCASQYSTMTDVLLHLSFLCDKMREECVMNDSLLLFILVLNVVIPFHPSYTTSPSVCKMSNKSRAVNYCCWFNRGSCCWSHWFTVWNRSEISRRTAVNDSTPAVGETVVKHARPGTPGPAGRW